MLQWCCGSWRGGVGSGGTKFNESVYTLCTVCTHCVYRKFDKFLMSHPAKIGQDSAKFGWMYSCSCTQYIVQTVCTHTVYTHQQSYNFGQDSAKFGWMYSCWCTQYSVHACTHSVHTPTILQFGAFWSGYRTAAPLECTTHGDIVYPEFEYM